VLTHHGFSEDWRKVIRSVGGKGKYWIRICCFQEWLYFPVPL